MRLVAVSVVKNEADIIEPFVRHTLAWADAHLIFDHASTDGTREILAALQREGLPLRLFTDDALGHLQHLRATFLQRLAVRELGADWVLLLDADEILTGPDRAALETALAATPPETAASLPMVNYLPTTDDPADEPNPVLRLRHCQTTPPHAWKLFVPASLAAREDVTVGKGSHALFRGEERLPDHRLPDAFFLGHLALRSPQHQILRVVHAELQKLSRGRANFGLDVHYRLGFQLLASNPDLFFSTIHQPAASLRLQPLAYRGTPLRLTAATEWNRVARALLPYLEKLAVSHGQFVDRAGEDHGTGAAPANATPAIRELTPVDLPPPLPTDTHEAFAGFSPGEGWCAQEGPYPEAYLPRFHWSLAPATQLTLDATLPRDVLLLADALTYSDDQTLTLALNDTPVHRHRFGGINQLERLAVPLTLTPGPNRLTLHFTQGLVSAHDPRRLAAIFLSLRLVPQPPI
jgi:hypothetical protein